MLMVCPCSPAYITVCGNKNIILLHLAVQLVNYIALLCSVPSHTHTFNILMYWVCQLSYTPFGTSKIVKPDVNRHYMLYGDRALPSSRKFLG